MAFVVATLFWCEDKNTVNDGEGLRGRVGGCGGGQVGGWVLPQHA